MAKMNFAFHIYKPANFFYLLYNFTNWHFSCRPWIGDYWAERTGEFSKGEKELLGGLTKIFKKYKFSLWPCFLTDNDLEAIRKLRKIITPDEVDIFKKSFVVFKPRFEKVWEVEGPNLKSWKAKLSKFSKNSNLIKEDLDRYFGIRGPENVDVLLLIGGDNAAGGGGANIQAGWVEQEIGLHATNPEPFILVMWHEYIHNAYKKITNKLIQDYIRNNKIEKEIYNLGYKGSPNSILNEPLTSQLFPNGYLAQKLFNSKVAWRLSESFLDWVKGQPVDVYNAQKFINARNYEQIKRYFENNKQIDDDILREIHAGYLDYLKFIDDKFDK